MQTSSLNNSNASSTVQNLRLMTNPRVSTLREENKEKKARTPVDFLDRRGAARRPQASGQNDVGSTAARADAQRRHQEAFFTALSQQHGGDENSVSVSITLMETILAEPDPVRQKWLLLEGLKAIGQIAVAQMLAVALLYFGHPKLAVEAQKFAAASFAKMIARSFRWALGIQG